MAVLTEAQKVFIVQRLACFRTPSEAAADVKDAFGIEIPRQQVEYYNPTKGAEPAEKWRAIFTAARERYLQAVNDEPIAHERFRLAKLAEMLRLAEGAHGGHTNPKLVLDILEQAAKEVGGAYTNHRVLEHSGEVDTGKGVHIYLPDNRRDDIPDSIRNRMAKAGGNGAGD